ncbi:hypothetical protein JCM17844_22000 [Iodidimonas gelatinilytica]|uniref:Uncharacterized protein n=2 Tax=Iodidimonas TaxID=2066486 RepID=A0A5A7MTF7_9PROT|nr:MULTISPECIES: hypothetical protein [Iodidimonas]GEQ98563.1 hypothetical protein JCM17844_22000 [Iodidimonas gelatinilytica]GER01762.1 hypothetical protein JCM17845_23850 [Iodidimonas gelatinilytica]GER06785.1 hypothetical protein JCM17843_10950 [Kordiimonadales bacterium JCM 17843]GGO09982.1 hypothetical protein GCM10007972_12170 [Iodidimonas muriae]
MGVFEMVVLIVLIATVGEIVKNRAKTKTRMEDLEKRLKELGVADQLKRVDDLEQRVRTLERIATDKRSRLHDEIDAL